MIDARSWVTNPQGVPTSTGPWRLNPAAVEGIAIHHSVTNTRADVDPRIEQLALQAIDKYHVSLDYGGIGYHAAAFPSGRAYWLGDWAGARSGVAFRNDRLVHIVAIGTFTDVLPDRPQLDALAECIRGACNFYGRSLEARGHNQWAVPGQGTICAGKLNGFDWAGYLAPQPVITPRDVTWAGAAAGMFLQEGRPLNGMHEFDKGTIRWLAKQV